MRIVITPKTILITLIVAGIVFVSYKYVPQLISGQTGQELSHSSELANLNSPADQIQGNETSSTWQKRCAITQNGDPLCEMFVRLLVRKSNQRLMEFALSPPAPSKTSNALIILPHGILVTKGGLLQIEGDTDGRQFQIHTCVETGCVARFNMPEDYLNRLKGAEILNISFAKADGQVLRIQIPMDGFTETYGSL